MKIPAGLQHLKTRPDAESWLRSLPERLRTMLREWDLRQAGPPFERAHVSLTLPVHTGSGRAVLKLQWPHPECLLEADALETWNGNGAVRLLAHDRVRHALLIEECRPGVALGELPNADPVHVCSTLLPCLWVPAGEPFRTLAEEAADWRACILPRWEEAGRPCAPRLIEATLDFLERLPGSQGEQVLLHQDLHGGNVLSSDRLPFLAIDPKPLIGEREFGLSPIINSFEFGHSRQQAVARLDGLATVLGLDRERARGWAIAQAVAWSFDTPFAKKRYDTAAWLLDAE